MPLLTPDYRFIEAKSSVARLAGTAYTIRPPGETYDDNWGSDRHRIGALVEPLDRRDLAPEFHLDYGKVCILPLGHGTSA